MRASRPVLVVDDNPMILRMLCDLLSHAGLTVLAASDAATCCKMIDEHHPGVLVLDVQLRDEDGLSVAQRLKADPLTAHIAIVVVTSYAMKGDEERATLAGCDLYVRKPIDTRTFPEIIAGYCAAASSG